MLRIYLLNYNYGAYIGETIASLLAQTDHDFAVTCIDNGSTDGSRETLQNACKTNGWKFEQFPNLPISKIGNHIAKTSSEPFIVRIDADDTFCPDFVSLAKAAIARDDSDIIYGNYHLMDFDSRVFSTQEIIPRGKGSQTPIHDEPFHGACTVIRREKLLEFGGYYEQFSRNDGFDLYLKFRNEKLVHLEQPLFQYRRGHRSMSTNKASLFEARVGMLNAYAGERGMSVGDDVMHVLAFPNHPQFYRDDTVDRYLEFLRSWGRNARAIVRDGVTKDSLVIPWSDVDEYDDLRAFLDEDVQFANVERFIVHSMSDPLAPLPFFEIAPVAMDIFESRSIITGAKLESSLYWTVAGGVSRQKNSRRLFEENRVVLHSGGLTGFDRGSPRDSIATLLEVSPAMMVDGHC